MVVSFADHAFLMRRKLQMPLEKKKLKSWEGKNCFSNSKGLALARVVSLPKKIPKLQNAKCCNDRLSPSYILHNELLLLAPRTHNETFGHNLPGCWLKSFFFCQFIVTKTHLVANVAVSFAIYDFFFSFSWIIFVIKCEPNKRRQRMREKKERAKDLWLIARWRERFPSGASGRLPKRLAVDFNETRVRVE